MTSTAGGRYLDHAEPLPFAPHGYGAQPFQPAFQQVSQEQLPSQLPMPRPTSQYLLQQHDVYSSSPVQPSSLEGFAGAPDHSLQQHQQSLTDASGRRFSLPAYHPSHYPPPLRTDYGQYAPPSQSGYGGQDGQFDPNALLPCDSLVSPISSNPSPNFAPYNPTHLREDADVSPSSSADELSATYSYQPELQQEYTPYAFGSLSQQQPQQQQQYSMADYTFGATPAAPMQMPEHSVAPHYLATQDVGGDGYDGGRRPSFNTAFSELGLASPAQHEPVWGAGNSYVSQVQNGSLPQQSMLQARHSSAGMPAPTNGYSMSGTQGSSFVPGAQNGSYPVSVPSPAPGIQYASGSFQQYLAAGAAGSAQVRRGSTSSILGTIAEQPPALAGTRLAYGVSAHEVDAGFSPPMNGERRCSLVGPAAVARKASLKQLRAQPYGQEPNRRSPGASGNAGLAGERRGSLVDFAGMAYQ